MLSPPKLTIQKKSKISKISSGSDLARVVAPKAIQMLYNFLSIGPRVILRSAFQLLRANTITRVLSAVVLVSIDTVSLIRHRISLKQYIINLILAIMLLIGGTAGWMIGNEAVGILIENIVLGFVVGLVGAGLFGGALAHGWELLVKKFVTDDTEDMLNICNQVFADMAAEYNLNDEEVTTVKNTVKIDAQTLLEMFTSSNRAEFARNLLAPSISEVVKRRN